MSTKSEIRLKINYYHSWVQMYCHLCAVSASVIKVFVVKKSPTIQLMDQKCRNDATKQHVAIQLSIVRKLFRQ